MNETNPNPYEAAFPTKEQSGPRIPPMALWIAGGAILLCVGLMWLAYDRKLNAQIQVERAKVQAYEARERFEKAQAQRLEETGSADVGD